MKDNVARNLVLESPDENTHHSFSSKEFAYEIVETCEEAKGKDVAVMDVSKLFGLSDYFIVVSARSDRQVQGIANRILGSFISPVTLEGMEKGHWVLMDFGEVVVHIFYEPLREHYDVEGLWIKAPRVTMVRDRKKGIIAKPTPLASRRTHASVSFV